MQKLLESKGKTWKEAQHMAKDRRMWTEFVIDQSVTPYTNRYKGLRLNY